MLYDHRTYTCRPGTIKKQIELYREFGMAPQVRNLGAPVFYAVTETGDVNQYIHIWAYKDAADRAARRANMMADPDWLAFLAKSAEAGYLVAQENRLMTPTDFFDSIKAG